MRGLEGGRAGAIVGLFLASALAGCASDPYAPEETTETGFGARVLPGTDVTGTESRNPEFGDVAGIVLNEAGVALPGAKVSLPGEVLAVTTGVGGRFEFSDIPPGAQKIRVEKEGYLTLVRTITVVAGHVTEIEAVLARAKGVNEGFVEHAHDHWLGQQNYTLFEGEIDPRRETNHWGVTHPLSSTDWMYWYDIIPETGRIVPPGTARLRIDVEFEPGPFFPPANPNAPTDRYVLYVYSPRITNPETGAQQAHDRTYYIESASSSFEFVLTTPQLVDHGHATATSWGFGMSIQPMYISGLSSKTAGLDQEWYDDLFLSPVSVTITAQKGDLLIDPPHPRYWKDSDRLVMNSSYTAIYCYHLDMILNPTGPDCPNRIPNPNEQGCYKRSQSKLIGGCMLLKGVVPVGATRIEFDLEHDWSPGGGPTQGDPESELRGSFTPDKFVIGYKTAKVPTDAARWSDYTWLEPTGTFSYTPPSDSYWGEGRRYTITVKADEADPFYARTSEWVFAVAVKGHEDANDWDAITCRYEQCGAPDFEIKNFTVINENRDEMLKEGEA